MILVGILASAHFYGTAIVTYVVCIFIFVSAVILVTAVITIVIKVLILAIANRYGTTIVTYVVCIFIFVSAVILVTSVVTFVIKIIILAIANCYLTAVVALVVLVGIYMFFKNCATTEVTIVVLVGCRITVNTNRPGARCCCFGRTVTLNNLVSVFTIVGVICRIEVYEETALDINFTKLSHIRTINIGSLVFLLVNVKYVVKTLVFLLNLELTAFDVNGTTSGSINNISASVRGKPSIKNIYSRTISSRKYCIGVIIISSAGFAGGHFTNTSDCYSKVTLNPKNVNNRTGSSGIVINLMIIHINYDIVTCCGKVNYLSKLDVSSKHYAIACAENYVKISLVVDFNNVFLINSRLILVITSGAIVINEVKLAVVYSVVSILRIVALITLSGYSTTNGTYDCGHAIVVVLCRSMLFCCRSCYSTTNRTYDCSQTISVVLCRSMILGRRSCYSTTYSTLNCSCAIVVVLGRSMILGRRSCYSTTYSTLNCSCAIVVVLCRSVSNLIFLVFTVFYCTSMIMIITLNAPLFGHLVISKSITCIILGCRNRRTIFTSIPIGLVCLAIAIILNAIGFSCICMRSNNTYFSRFGIEGNNNSCARSRSVKHVIFSGPSSIKCVVSYHLKLVSCAGNNSKFLLIKTGFIIVNHVNVIFSRGPIAKYIALAGYGEYKLGFFVYFPACIVPSADCIHHLFISWNCQIFSLIPYTRVKAVTLNCRIKSYENNVSPRTIGNGNIVYTITICVSQYSPNISGFAEEISCQTCACCFPNISLQIEAGKLTTTYTLAIYEVMTDHRTYIVDSICSFTIITLCSLRAVCKTSSISVRHILTIIVVKHGTFVGYSIGCATSTSRCLGTILGTRRIAIGCIVSESMINCHYGTTLTTGSGMSAIIVICPTANLVVAYFSFSFALCTLGCAIVFVYVIFSYSFFTSATETAVLTVSCISPFRNTMTFDFSCCATIVTARITNIVVRVIFGYSIMALGAFAAVLTVSCISPFNNRMIFNLSYCATYVTICITCIVVNVSKFVTILITTYYTYCLIFASSCATIVEFVPTTLLVISVPNITFLDNVFSITICGNSKVSSLVPLVVPIVCES